MTITDTSDLEQAAVLRQAIAFMPEPERFYKPSEIRALMHVLKVPSQVVANAIGVSVDSVRSWAQGRVHPTPEHAASFQKIGQLLAGRAGQEGIEVPLVSGAAETVVEGDK